MDAATLSSLLAALQASPDNTGLRRVVVEALLDDNDVEQAFDLVRDIAPDSLVEDAERALFAKAARLAGDPERAVRLCEGVQDGAALVERARCLLAHGDVVGARNAYNTAIAHNATLEDAVLQQKLKSNVHVAKPSTAGPRLTVLRHDNTDATETTRMVVPEVEDDITFAKVGGLDDVKDEIRRRIILPFQKPELYKRFKKRVGGGILMYGPPGCGKTMLARATAGECDAKFMHIAISDVLDMYIGESERKLHALFEKARADAPCVLFFDELEALAGKRANSRDANASKTVSQFLSEMDGFAQNNHGVLILGATNVPWNIDPAFRRPGRFDRVLFVPPPDRTARHAILDGLLAERPCEDGLDCAEFAQATSGFSGADLAHLVETAADYAIEASLAAEQEVPIHIDHIRRALQPVKPTTQEWLTQARNYARYANTGGQYDDVLDFIEKAGKAKGGRR